MRFKLRFLRQGLLVAAATLAMGFVPGFLGSAFAQYAATTLVSNQSGAAPTTDANLVNAWGIISGPTSPFWVSDNVTGKSTLYLGSGAIVPLVVTIPTASGTGTGTPTGVVFNFDPSATDFLLTDPNTSKTKKPIFLFATVDGTISGWNPGLNAGNVAVIGFTATNGASYTGLTMAENGGAFFLYAADNSANREVDVFNSSFTRVNTISDPAIPRDFAPYNVRAIDGQLWVTYTALDKAQGGFVDVFALDGTLVHHDFLLGPLHSPWGLALAPSNFGEFSNDILVGNNVRDGRINAFDPSTGQFQGTLTESNGQPIVIDQLWGLEFGKGAGANGKTFQLFFTAGTNFYGDGAFGVVEPVQP
ncbi:MAG TPA: TIGR03118 family protein [Candidatus Acidoferrales bacterium]|nr:TIGR03118 family protein [Candidatus Acidoferrales bacterium]